LIQERAGGWFEADARAPIEKLEEKLGVSLMLPDHEDEFDTAGGLASALAGRVPQRGEILHHPSNLDVEILDADPRRVKRLRVKRGEPAASAETPRIEPKSRAQSSSDA
jgi:CBS domain containing-hemolysin-like protein